MSDVSLREAKNVGIIGSVLTLVMPIIGWFIGPILMAICIKKVDENYGSNSFFYYLAAIIISFIFFPLYLFYSNSYVGDKLNLFVEAWFFVPGILFFISFYRLGRKMKRVSFLVTGALIIITVCLYIYLVNDYNNDPYKGGDFGQAGIGIVIFPFLIFCLISQIVAFARLAAAKE